MEVFSGIPRDLHDLLRGDEPDLKARHDELPALQSLWHERKHDIRMDWGGVVHMDTNGAIMGLRKMNAGRTPLN